MNTDEMSSVVQKWLTQTFSNIKNNIFSFLCLSCQRWLPTCEGVGWGSRWCWRETDWCWPAWLEEAGLCSTAGLSTTATSPTGHHSTGQLSRLAGLTFCHGSLLSPFPSFLLRIFYVFSHGCSMENQLPLSDGVCLEKVRTFRQWSQSEINNYISTINMYMVWGKKRRTNQYVWASFSAFLSVPPFVSSSALLSLSLYVLVGKS